MKKVESNYWKSGRDFTLAKLQPLPKAAPALKAIIKS